MSPVLLVLLLEMTATFFFLSKRGIIDLSGVEGEGEGECKHACECEYTPECDCEV